MQDCTGRNGIVPRARRCQMQGIYQVIKPMALKSTAFGIVQHAKPELTARLWFRVLNSLQGQSIYSGFSRRAGHIGRDKVSNESLTKR